MQTTLELVKILYAVVCDFNEAISMDDKTTTAIVDTDAKDIGKYITRTISANTKTGGTFSRCLSMDARF